MLFVCLSLINPPSLDVCAGVSAAVLVGKLFCQLFFFLERRMMHSLAADHLKEESVHMHLEGLCGCIYMWVH